MLRRSAYSRTISRSSLLGAPATSARTRAPSRRSWRGVSCERTSRYEGESGIMEVAGGRVTRAAGAERAATWWLPAFTADEKLVRHSVRRETHRAEPLDQLFRH